jgi:hypothetical protein
VRREGELVAEEEVAAMQSVLPIGREKAIIQSLLKIEGDPQILVGMQFIFCIPDRLDMENVEVLEVGESGEEVTVKRVGGEEIYERVRIGQLSIGKGRTSGEPLIELMGKHGFDPGPCLQRDEFRTPTGRSGSVSSSPRRHGADRENMGGLGPFRGATPHPGSSRKRAATPLGPFNARGFGGEGGIRGRRTPFRQFEAPDLGARETGPFAPAAMRRRQASIPGEYVASLQIRMEEGFHPFPGVQQARVQPPQQVGQMAGPCPLGGQQGFPPGNDFFARQGIGGAGGVQALNQLYNEVEAGGRIRAAGYPQLAWGERPLPAGFRGGGSGPGPTRMDAEQGGLAGAVGVGDRQVGAGVEGVTREVMERLAAFERKLNIQSARTGIEADMRRAQGQINQDKDPGLFAQMDMASTIYSAPEKWKGIIALMGGLSAVLKVPTSKLAFLGDELVSTGLQKCREAGENLTVEQVASIENAVLETYRAKKAKAEELVARNPDWVKKG